MCRIEDVNYFQQSIFVFDSDCRANWPEIGLEAQIGQVRLRFVVVDAEFQRAQLIHNGLVKPGLKPSNCVDVLHRTIRI